MRFVQQLSDYHSETKCRKLPERYRRLVSNRIVLNFEAALSALAEKLNVDTDERG